MAMVTFANLPYLHTDVNINGASAIVYEHLSSFSVLTVLNENHIHHLSCDSSLRKNKTGGDFSLVYSLREMTRLLYCLWRSSLREKGQNQPRAPHSWGFCRQDSHGLGVCHSLRTLYFCKIPMRQCANTTPCFGGVSAAAFLSRQRHLPFCENNAVV